MVQAQNQENVELEREITEFITNYVVSDNWKAEDAKVKDALKALQDEKSAFAVEFGKQLTQYPDTTKGIKKIIENACSMKIPVMLPGFEKPISLLNVALFFMIGVSAGQDKEGEGIVTNLFEAISKREDAQEVMKNCDIALLATASMFLNQENSLLQNILYKCIILSTNNGQDLLKPISSDIERFQKMLEGNQSNVGSSKNDNILSMLLMGKKYNLFTLLCQTLTEEKMNSFLNEKLGVLVKEFAHVVEINHAPAEVKRAPKQSNLTQAEKMAELKEFFSRPPQDDKALPEKSDFVKEQNIAAQIVLLLSLGADKEAQLPDNKTIFDLMGKNCKHLDELVELSDKIKTLSEQLAKAAVEGKHMYQTNPDDMYRFKRDITLMLVTGNVSQNPGFAKLVKDLVENPGNGKNPELIKGLSKDIMERSKDMIKGMSDNWFHRLLENLYNLCAAFYYRDFSIFTKGSVTLDASKFNPEGKSTKNFADKIEAEIAERAKKPVVAAEGEKKDNNFAEKVQQGRAPGPQQAAQVR